MKILLRMLLLFTVFSLAVPGMNAFAEDLSSHAVDRTSSEVREDAEEHPFAMRTTSLGDNPLPPSGPLPSPDGKYILTHSATHLILREWGSDRQRILAESGGKELFANVYWSPDGHYISFNKLPQMSFGTQPVNSRYSDIHLLMVKTGEIRLIPGTANAREISWSPDAQKLGILVLPEKRYENTGKFLEAATTKPGDANFPSAFGEARLVSIQTGESKVMGPASPWADFTWSPDSKRVAFMVRQNAEKTNEIRVFTVATGESKRFPIKVPSEFAPFLLGTSIPPLPETPGATNLNLRHMAGSGWTANDELAFSTVRGNSWKFFLMPISTGVPREICSEPAARLDPECQAFSPDGASEIFTRRDTRQMILRNLKTNSESPILHNSSEETFLIVSPNGRLVVFASNRDGHWGLYVVPLDRGPVSKPILIADLHSNPKERLGAWWTPDGRLVLGLKFPTPSLYRLEMNPKTGHATGDPKILTNDKSNASFGPSVSADGKHIAYWRIKGSQKGLAVLNANGQGDRFLLEYPVELSNAPQLAWHSLNEIMFIDVRRKDPDFVGVNIETGVVQRFPARNIGFRKWAYLPGRKEMIVSPATGNPKSILNLNALESAFFSDLEPPAETAPVSPLKFRSVADASQNPFSRFIEEILSLLKLHSPGEGAERAISGMDAKNDTALDFAVSPDAGRIAYLHVANADLDSLKQQIRLQNLAGIPLDIRLIDFAGGENKPLVIFPNFNPITPLENKLPEPQSFSPDGKFLVYSDPRGRLSVVDTQTGNNWSLINSYVAGWKDARWSKDGSIVLTKVDTAIEWKSFEGVTYDAVIRLMESRAQK